jgi:hypothetical protein
MRIFTTSFLFGLVALVAISATKPPRIARRAPLLAFNSQIAALFGADDRFLPGNFEGELKGTPADSAATAYNVLLFNYSAYDSLYATQMRQYLQRELPGATVTDFKNESAARLGRLLEKQHVVIVTYASSGDPEVLEQMGKRFDAFVRAGGVVVFTGTHETDAIAQMGLLHPDEVTYSEDMAVQHSRPDHAMLKGIQNNFTSTNFIYPMEFADSDFNTVAEAEGMTVLGYKELGDGKVVYLGLEYYSDDAVPSRLLANLFKWAVPQPQTATKTEVSFRQPIRRTEEILYAGSTTRFDLKIYPNPYMEKAAIEIDIDKQSIVSAEMTNETGALTATLLPQRTLTTGFYRLELPSNIAPGIYYVKCKIGNHIEVRKVVKMANN